MEEIMKIEEHPQYHILKAQWDRDKSLHEEFMQFENFFFYKAEMKGITLKQTGGGR